MLESSTPTPESGDNPASGVKKGQSETEISLLEKSTEELNELVAWLESSLSPVLREVEGKDACTSAPTEPLAPLPESVRKCRYRVSSVNCRLGDILDRLEI